MQRPIAYDAGWKAYHAGVSFELGYRLYLTDTLGQYCWEDGWKDARATEAMKGRESNATR